MGYITKNKGFTLIEMVVVIVVLGILAITAAPRFMNTSTDAKIASLDGFIGAFRAAESIVEGKLAMEGKDMKSQKIVTTKDGIRAGFGSIILDYENLQQVMNIDGYRIVTCLDDTQMLVLPSSYKQIINGKSSHEADACLPALKTSCWVSLYNTELGHNTIFQLAHNYTGC